MSGVGAKAEASRATRRRRRRTRMRGLPLIQFDGTAAHLRDYRYFYHVLFIHKEGNRHGGGRKRIIGSPIERIVDVL